jgi:hypothetical protein
MFPVDATRLQRRNLCVHVYWAAVLLTTGAMSVLPPFPLLAVKDGRL